MVPNQWLLVLFIYLKKKFKIPINPFGHLGFTLFSYQISEFSISNRPMQIVTSLVTDFFGKSKAPNVKKRNCRTQSTENPHEDLGQSRSQFSTPAPKRISYFINIIYFISLIRRVLMQTTGVHVIRYGTGWYIDNMWFHRPYVTHSPNYN